MKLGGQAVIEGVMIKSDTSVVIALQAGRKIKVIGERLKPFSAKHPWATLPLIRGVVNLIEMLILGTRALNISTRYADDEEEKLSPLSIFLTMLISLIIAVLIFKFIPLFIAQASVGSSSNSALFALIDGLVKVAIFFLYVFIIGRFKDIQRVFQYHGAEHMSVHCHEAKRPLTVKNVARFSPLHPRCGTSFLVLVLLISIIFYAFIPNSASLPLKLFIRLLLLPLIAGVAYEFIRLEHKMRNTVFINIILFPGMLFQKLTTAKPKPQQIRVAIAAVKKAKAMG
ncbi:MAG: DUF1385 domain-containing protein [Nanoarchaeota archaeon]